MPILIFSAIILSLQDALDFIEEIGNQLFGRLEPISSRVQAAESIRYSATWRCPGRDAAQRAPALDGARACGAP
jgi:hypothetical protein